MSISVKHFLLLILFASFALAALTNSERTWMIELVKVVTLGTLVIMAYEVWTSGGEKRAYCAGFALWGGFYYAAFVIMRQPRIDLGTDTLLAWLAPRLDSGHIMYAVFEKTGHLLLSLLFGVIGGWVTAYYYRRRQHSIKRKPTP